MVAHENTAAGIERSLTLSILRGTYAPGSRLPTVRELAREYAVNPATIERAVSRLETRGLITARQGSGLKVNDPSRAGDVSLVPYWLESVFEDPDRAARILDDFLMARRLIAARTFVRYRDRLLEERDALGDAADAMIGADPGDIESFQEADLSFARLVLQKTGNTVAVAVFNTMVRVLDEIPIVARAMYAEPQKNVASMTVVFRAFVEGRSDLAEFIESAMAEVDDRTVSHFRRLLQARIDGEPTNNPVKKTT